MDGDLITMMVRMIIELCVMDRIRVAQLVNGLPDQWIAKKVHLGLARDMDEFFRLHSLLSFILGTYV